MFVELLLVMIITEAKSPHDDSLVRVFDRAVETPQVIKRLQYFIKKYVRNSDLVSSRDKETVKRGCKIAVNTLERLGNMAAVDE
jgi:hypothetical protein